MDIKKLKKENEEALQPKGTSVADFVIDYEVLVEQYLALITEYSEKIAFNEVWDKVYFKPSASKDPFSEKFEKSVRRSIKEWIILDEHMRKDFQGILNHYWKNVDPTEMEKVAKNIFYALNPEDSVQRANQLAASWLKRMESINVSLPGPLMTIIDWFHQLTVEELERDFVRSIKENAGG